MALDLKPDALRLFAEIGFLGIGRGCHGAAEAIFAMHAALRPGDEAAAIGRAMTALAAGRADRAVQVLREADQSPAVMAFSVVALARLGERARAAELAGDLRDMDGDEALLAMCEAAITAA